MDTIAGFVADFSRNHAQYVQIEKQLEVLCNTALHNIDFLWQSRVKDPESLRKKLQDRQANYKNECENVCDIKDLVGGRIILTHWHDLAQLKNSVEQHFNVIFESQHPKSAMDLSARFRGYSALHFHVTRRDSSDKPFPDLIIELQVMSPAMWWFSTLEHDVIYKQKQGPPDRKIAALIEMLKGNANQGEIISQQIEDLQIEEHLRPGFEKLLSQRRTAGFDSRPGMADLAAEVAGTVVRQDSEKFEKVILELTSRTEDWRRTDEESKCLQVLYQSDYRAQKARNPDRVPGTCKWFLNNSKYGSWIEKESSDLVSR